MTNTATLILAALICIGLPLSMLALIKSPPIDGEPVQPEPSINLRGIVCDGVYLIGNAALWVLAFGALGFVVGWVVGMLA
jgi:hypothetical protein